MHHNQTVLPPGVRHQLHDTVGGGHTGVGQPVGEEEHGPHRLARGPFLQVQACLQASTQVGHASGADLRHLRPHLPLLPLRTGRELKVRPHVRIVAHQGQPVPSIELRQDKSDRPLHHGQLAPTHGSRPIDDQREVDGSSLRAGIRVHGGLGGNDGQEAGGSGGVAEVLQAELGSGVDWKRIHRFSGTSGRRRLRWGAGGLTHDCVRRLG
mmetsp:Transcript_97947/g.261440  ORF Transcript_97947/g.261440 Transcript_97947/m.261440 type:complete len:210 (+) Transcript_97947:1085-1714(+)